MKINLIVANSQNEIIKKQNNFPWQNQKDFKQTKKIPIITYVIMGRKTFELMGKPLKNNVNIVLSKTRNEIPGTRVFDCVEDVIFWLYNQDIAFPKMQKEAFVLGGNKICKDFKKRDNINTIYQTM